MSAGRFQLVYGADCSVLLATAPALRDVAGEVGLVFVDGHEDNTLLEVSPDGEAANMEIVVLLGLTCEQAPAALRARLPVLHFGQIAMLGPRDHAHRRELDAPTLADRVLLRTPDELLADPEERARGAVGHVAARTPPAGGCTSTSTSSRKRSSLPEAPPARTLCPAGSPGCS